MSCEFWETFQNDYLPMLIWKIEEKLTYRADIYNLENFQLVKFPLDYSRDYTDYAVLKQRKETSFI